MYADVLPCVLGGLVKKILETKKELEDGQGPQKKTQIVSLFINGTVLK